MTAKSHPAAMRFIPDQCSAESMSNIYVSSMLDSLAREPARYALRTAYILFVQINYTSSNLCGPSKMSPLEKSLHVTPEYPI